MLKNHPAMLFFILALFGQSFVILGWKTGMNEILVFGVGFLVLATLAFLRRLRFMLIVTALSSMFAGSILGGLAGRFLGLVSMQAMGIVGGALLGALAGMAFWVSFEPRELIAHYFENALPKLAKIVLYIPMILAGILGAILGVTGLKDVLPAYFGNEGSGAFVGAVMGLSAILFLAAPFVRRINDLTRLDP
ncbi:MAG: hypothetical protein WA821_18800 [Anaerolineales bacterium]